MPVPRTYISDRALCIATPASRGPGPFTIRRTRRYMRWSVIVPVTAHLLGARAMRTATALNTPVSKLMQDQSEELTRGGPDRDRRSANQRQWAPARTEVP